MAEKYDSLAHTKYYTRYHIIFAPKYRRKIIYNQLRKDISEYIKRLLRYKGVKIVEGHMMSDHVHILVSIPPKYSVFKIMGYLIYKFGNRHFWAEGYYVSTAGLNESTVRKYIQDQEKDDIAKDKLSVKEYEDPFGEDKGSEKKTKTRRKNKPFTARCI